MSTVKVTFPVQSPNYNWRSVSGTSAAKSGYTPIGVVGFSNNYGWWVANCVLVTANNTINALVGYIQATDYVVTMDVYVLYVKN